MTHIRKNHHLTLHKDYVEGTKGFLVLELYDDGERFFVEAAIYQSNPDRWLSSAENVETFDLDVPALEWGRNYAHQFLSEAAEDDE